MTKLIRTFTLTIMMMSMLASCSFFNSATETPLLIVQPTAALSQLVTIELTVQADTTLPFNAVGQVIKYNYNVKNTGSTVTPGPVTIAGATCPTLNTVGNLDGVLDVNETLVCTSSYTITQADLDKGSVTSLTTANVNGINSNPVSTTVAMAPSTVLKLTKTANPVVYDHVGQIITYSYVITNSGAATLGPAQFTVTDAGIGAPINCGAANLSLASNLTVTCSAAYAITQANMDSGSVASSATASGGGVGASQPASATITKGTAAQSNSNPANLVAGSTIQHKVVAGEWLWQIARCYGADPQKVRDANPPTPGMISPNTTVTVPNIGSAGKIYGPPCVGTYTVQSGDTWSSIALKYNADPTVLQMVNANTLTVGKVLKVPLNSAGATSSNSNPSPKALTLTISASPLTYDQVSQIITFTYVIKNSGTETLGPAQFTVSGGLLGAIPLNCGSATTSLAPTATVSCTSTYAILQADLTKNTITHQAIASGAGAIQSPTASVTVNLKTPDTKVLTLTITANPSTYNQLGQVITFTYVIKNSGSGTLGPAQFTVNGSLSGATPLNCGDANVSLGPNLSVTCTAVYAIVQADLNTSSITNQATASGGGAGPSQTASVTIAKQ